MRVAEGVKVSVGVIVGAKNWPGAQLDIRRVTNNILVNRKRIMMLGFVFIVCSFAFTIQMVMICKTSVCCHSLISHFHLSLS